VRRKKKSEKREISDRRIPASPFVSTDPRVYRTPFPDALDFSSSFVKIHALFGLVFLSVFPSTKKKVVTMMEREGAREKETSLKSPRKREERVKECVRAL